MSIRKIREKLNLLLYDSKEKVLSIFKILHLLISSISMLSLVIYYGYTFDSDTIKYFLKVIEFSFAFYILRFVIRFIYDFNPREFIRKNRIEFILILYLILEGIVYNVVGKLAITTLFETIGIYGIGHYTVLIIQLSFFGFILYEFTKDNEINPFYRIHPATVFISSFLVIILIGTGMLMMPEMTNGKESMGFLDALFMSSSATCVTGLSLVDVHEFYTFKGQLVLLILMKLGGLNIISFGAFILLASRLGVGVKQHELIEDFVNRDSILSTRGMLGRIIIWSVSIELLGTLFLYFSWGVNVPEVAQTSDRVFYSIFHSVSAFNNAGFSLFSDGLYNSGVQTNYSVHIIIAILIVLGALGMASLFDIFSISKIRERYKNPWKKLEFGTKISINYTLMLIFLGFALFFILEYNNTLEGKTTFGKIVTSFFQSITTRTAGFNTVDTGSITMPVVILFAFLMFIGASSSSTGGGIKTSTLAVLWATIISTVRGKKHIELYKRTIDSELALKAFSVLLFFIVGNLIGIFVLTITEQDLMAKESVTLSEIIFEEVSAFSTVGLSAGITSEVSDAGKIVLIFSMFIGRVGTLTVGFLVGRRVLSTNYKYPKGHTMIG
ncbi:MAG: potassium transporter TrkG [Crocinitomicaceae bacterium]